MASKLRYGFKSEANELARAMRRELGVEVHEPLDPWRLAELLGVPILRLSELEDTTPEATHFLRVEPEAFSAATVFHGRRRAIVHNDQHSPGRQANDISHELSHALLRHEPAPALNILGCRDWESVLEEEATWLGTALLVSDEAALHIARSTMTVAEAAALYGVSERVISMRLNVTGARRRVSLPRRGALPAMAKAVPPSQGQRAG